MPLDAKARSELNILRNRVKCLEKKVNDHENAFRWFEVAKKFFGKAVVAAYAAKVEIEKDGKQ